MCVPRPPKREEAWVRGYNYVTVCLHQSQVLLPRTKSNFVHRHMTRINKKKQEGELAVNSNPLSEIAGDRLKEMDKVHQMESDELKFAKQLRSENLVKADRDERLKSGVIAGCPVVYCFCRKPESGYMLQCELCNEWYHATCLHIPKGKRTPGKDLGKEARFLCVTCMRTRRPRLDAIVSLLISLQKVPVAISEGTALHCLAERAIAWQRRARQAMTSGTSLLEAAKQQRKRIGELKTNIRKWRAEAESNRLLSTTIEAQLASSAGMYVCMLHLYVCHGCVMPLSIDTILKQYMLHLAIPSPPVPLFSMGIVTFPVGIH